MAKRTTPRSEADDAPTTAPATGRKARPVANTPPARGRDVASQTATGQDQAGRMSDTFVGEPDTLGEPVQGQDSRQAATSATSMGSEPSEEDIRMRAYHRYLERGGGHGMDYDDWLAAERELRNKQS